MALKLEGLGTNGATHVASLETILEECLGVTVTIAADGTVTRLSPSSSMKSSTTQETTAL